MPSKKYEFLLFDLDGTLFDFEKGEEDALLKSFRKFNINTDFETFQSGFKKINLKIWEEFEQKLITADKLKAERFNRLFKLLNLNINPGKFSDEYLANLSKTRFLIDGAEEVLEFINEKFKLALITNGLSKVQRGRLKGSVLEKYFDTVIISEEVGSPKPEKRIFEISFEKAGHNNKETTLIIGDNLSSDIKGGIDFGIDTCWINLFNNSAKNGIKPTYEINKLVDLIDLLK